MTTDPVVAEVDSLRAKLAAERAKVERVAVIRAEWAERKADEPCHELYVALGRALAGGEQVRTTISNTSTPPKEYYQ